MSSMHIPVARDTRPAPPRRARRHGGAARGAAARISAVPQPAEERSLPLVLRHRLSDDQPCAAEIAFTTALARSLGNTDPLDAPGWLLRQVDMHAVEWGFGPIAVLLPDAPLSSRMLTQMAELLTGGGLSADRVDVILPESALLAVDPDGMLSLAALRDLGAGLCVDGFGAGVTSLALLRRLPLTGLKLSRALVRGLPDEREDSAIVRAVIGAAHALGLTVIGDGVEAEGQRAFLAHCGCDEGQGALFGAPLLVPAARRGALVM